MKVYKILSLLVACFTLLVGSVANAAIPYCLADANQPMSEMQMDHSQMDMDMPCHETADNEKHGATSCDECDCQYCVMMTLVSAQSFTQVEAAFSMKMVETQSIDSRQPEGVFQPPKPLS